MLIPQVQAQHPFTSFFSNLFGSDGKQVADATKAQEESVPAKLGALPRPAQLLLAHCLEQSNPYMTLLDSDMDNRSLLAAGWLVSVPCPTTGIVCFKIESHVWWSLRALMPQFMNAKLRTELEYYRWRKTAIYPWIWWGKSA